jgi:CubicO group peptidase (beta-lactamase class C family)
MLTRARAAVRRSGVMLVLIVVLGSPAALGDSAGSRLAPADRLPAPDYDAGSGVAGREDWALGPGRAETFRNIEEILPTRRVAPPATASVLRPATAPLAIRYEFRGRTYSLDDFVARTDTTALLVLRGDRILHEGYYRGADRQDRFMSFSAGKSLTSTLVGLAIADGKIGSVEDPIVRYLPELAGSAYEHARIVDVLQMSSGTSYTEEYVNPDSDIARIVAIYSRGEGGAYDFARSFRPARPPGQKFVYASADTEVLGALVARVTGRSFSAYMSERLWQPIGAEAAARWILDQPGSRGREMAMGGLQARLRDYGRFGQLFANGGRVGALQLLPAGWVEAATRPSAPHVDYGRVGEGDLGYGYQWWCIPGPHRAFTAEGIHGQFVMVDPVLKLVVVKLSSWRDAWDDEKAQETLAFFSAVSAAQR